MSQIELHNILTFLLDNQNIIDLETKQKFNCKKIINQEINSAKKKDNLSELKENPNIFSPKFKNNYLYIQHLLTSSIIIHHPSKQLYNYCLQPLEGLNLQSYF